MSELEDPYKDFMDQEQDIRQARSRLSFVDPTVNIAADRFDRDEDSSAAAGVGCAYSGVLVQGLFHSGVCAA